MKKVKYAIPSSDGIDFDGRYITEGRKYKAFDFDSKGQDSFHILDDNGEMRYCLVEGCAHLNSGNWEITYE